jgi:dTDP-4-dehydrorhamnose reductase
MSFAVAEPVVVFSRSTSDHTVMVKRQKTLLLGGSSYIGRALFSRLGPGRVLATYCRTHMPDGVFFDSTSMNLADVVSEPEEYSHAVILLGETKPDACVQDAQRARALNVDSIKTIIQALKEWGVKPVFTSSECVFDGVKGDYVETDPVNPILTYGRQKVEIEEHLQDTCDDCIIVRLARVYGSHRGDGTFLTEWLDAIEAGKRIYCARDQITSAIHVKDVVEAIRRLIQNDCAGVFHLAGPNAGSKLEFFNILATHLRERRAVAIDMVPCGINEFPVQEKRPLNLSMKPDKLLRATGLQLTSFEQACQELVG